MTIEAIAWREEPQDSKVCVTLRVTGGTKADLVKDALRQIAREQGMSGYQGMSVTNLREKLEQRLGATFLEQRVAAFIAQKTALPLAKERGLKLLFLPEVANRTIAGIFDKSLSELEVVLVLKPVYELSSYAPVTISESPALVTEEMIDAQLRRELARLATLESVDGPVKEGDMVVASMTTLADGQPEPGLSGDHLRILLERGSMPDGFVDNVVGMEQGDHREFSFNAVDRGNAGAVPVAFQVSLDVLEHARMVFPELTDELVSSRLSETDKTVEQFRKRIRIHLARQLKDEMMTRRADLVDAELGSRLQCVLPDSLIERTRDEMIDSMRMNATMQGLTLLQFVQMQGLDERQFQMQVTRQARESLRQGLALDALYEKLQLPLTDGDYQRALSELAPGNEDIARESFLRNDAWFLVEQMAQRLKAHQWAVETASF